MSQRGEHKHGTSKGGVIMTNDSSKGVKGIEIKGQDAEGTDKQEPRPVLEFS